MSIIKHDPYDPALMALYGGDDCDPCEDPSPSGYICTRESGHEGPHVAHSGRHDGPIERVSEVWE